MPHYRAYWESPDTDGCTDGEAESAVQFEQLVAERLAVEFSDKFTILSVVEHTPALCRECGQPLGNLGLNADECVNEACPLYAQGGQ